MAEADHGQLESTGTRWRDIFKNPAFVTAFLTACVTAIIGTIVALNTAYVGYVIAATNAQIEVQKLQVELDKVKVQLAADAEKSLRQYELDRAKFERTAFETDDQRRSDQNQGQHSVRREHRASVQA